jgi:hypothetical protein
MFPSQTLPSLNDPSRMQVMSSILRFIRSSIVIRFINSLIYYSFNSGICLYIFNSHGWEVVKIQTVETGEGYQVLGRTGGVPKHLPREVVGGGEVLKELRWYDPRLGFLIEVEFILCVLVA